MTELQETVRSERQKHRGSQVAPGQETGTADAKQLELGLWHVLPRAAPGNPGLRPARAFLEVNQEEPGEPIGQPCPFVPDGPILEALPHATQTPMITDSHTQDPTPVPIHTYTGRFTAVNLTSADTCVPTKQL